MSAFALLPVLLLLVVLALVAVGVYVLARTLRRRPDDTGAGSQTEAEAGESLGHAVRRFFQYLLLLGLLFSAAGGVSGLLGRVLDPGATLVRDDTGLALQLTLTLIALPLWGALAWWTHRRLQTDAGEGRSIGWAAYLTIVGLVSLVVAMVGWRSSLAGLVGTADYRSGQLAMALVWTLLWVGHHLWGRRATPVGRLQAERLLASLVGLVTAATGAILVLAASLRELLGLTGDTLVGGAPPALLDGAVVLLVGAAAWTVYWLLGTLRARRGTGWLALVLLVGVAGGLLTAVVSVSALGYDVLVWLVGDPAEQTAREHFSAVPRQLATALVGLLVWWYHSEVLGTGRRAGRPEVRRVYEYVLAAVGLLAAAAGLVMVLVTLVEAIAAGSDLVVGGSALNALLAALVLLAVGLPVWWWHWRRAQRARRAAPEGEVASPTRRTYLLVLFGVMGVTAVIALLTLVFLLLEDALAGGIDLETMRSIRFALGILATTSLLSAYHWTVFRSDRDAVAAIAPGQRPGPAAPVPVRTLLLVGAADDGVAAALQVRTGAQVQVVLRTDLQAPPWSVEEVAAAVAGSDHDVLVLAEPDGLRTVPVRR